MRAPFRAGPWRPGYGWAVENADGQHLDYRRTKREAQADAALRTARHRADAALAAKMKARTS